MFKKIFLLVCVLPLAACASLYGTFAEDENGKSKVGFDSRVYVGTKTDAGALIFIPICAGGGHPCGKRDEWLYLLWPLVLVDLPLSFISDTLLLPYTLTVHKPKEPPKEKTIEPNKAAALKEKPKTDAMPTPAAESSKREEECSANTQRLSAQEYCACLGMSLDPDTKVCFQGNKEMLHEIIN